MEDAVLVEITIKIADKLLKLYESGSITYTQLGHHMWLKSEFLKKALASARYKDNHDIKSILQRYEIFRGACSL